jgi:hypothetical protein
VGSRGNQRSQCRKGRLISIPSESFSRPIDGRFLARMLQRIQREMRVQEKVHQYVIGLDRAKRSSGEHTRLIDSAGLALE